MFPSRTPTTGAMKPRRDKLAEFPLFLPLHSYEISLPVRQTSFKTEITTTMPARMRITAISPFVSTASVCCLALLASCGERRDDSDPLEEIASAYRAAIRAHPAIPKSDALIEELQKAGVNNSSEFPDTAEKLRGLARRADSAGRNGNTEAAAILAAGIHAKAGAIAMNEALTMNSRVKATMGSIEGLINSAILLDVSASSRENLDLTSRRQYLANERADANSQLATAESQLDGIRNPIETAITNRDAKKDRAAQLDAQAAGVARRGLDAGPLEGHELIEESIDLRLQAHSQRISAAREDLTLVELEPGQRIAEKGRDGQQSRLDAARESEAATEIRQNNAADYAQDIRTQIQEIQGRLAPILQQLATEQTQSILPNFNAAAQDFAASSNAAKKATRGGSVEQSNDAWLAVANGELGSGRVFWAMANNIEGRAALLNRLVSSGDLLGDESRWRNDLKDTQQAHTDAITAAEASYKAALQSLGEVRGHAEETNRIRQSIELAIQAMEGADLVSIANDRRSESTTAKRPTRSSQTSGAQVDRSAPGFASPEAVIQAFPPQSWSDIIHLVASMSATEPSSQELLKLAKNAIAAVKPYADACIERYGKMGDLNDGLSQVAPMGTPKVESQSGNSAVLVAGEDGSKLFLTKPNGRWFINLDETIAESTKENPQAAQMLPMLGMMLSPIIQQVKTVAEEVAAGIRSGTYPTVEDAQAAFDEKVGEIVGQLLGGMGGGAGGGPPGIGGGAGGGPPGMGGGFPGGGFPSGGN